MSRKTQYSEAEMKAITRHASKIYDNGITMDARKAKAADILAEKLPREEKDKEQQRAAANSRR